MSSAAFKIFLNSIELVIRQSTWDILCPDVFLDISHSNTLLHKKHMCSLREMYEPVKEVQTKPNSG